MMGAIALKVAQELLAAVRELTTEIRLLRTEVQHVIHHIHEDKDLA